MLKIKDGIDLKELEKFGFEPNNKKLEKYTDIPNELEWYEYDLEDNRTYLVIGAKDDDWGEIGLSSGLYGDYPAYYIDNLDVLFDLIQVGLVVKTE